MVRRGLLIVVLLAGMWTLVEGRVSAHSTEGGNCARMLRRDAKPGFELTALRLGSVLEVSARSNRPAGTRPTVVCAWHDTDGDGRWDRDEPAVRSGDRNARWVAVDGDTPFRSTYSTSVTMPGADDTDVCVRVATGPRGYWPLSRWHVSAPVCDAAAPPIEVPEVPFAPMLGASALAACTLAAWRGRRRTV